MRFRHLVLRAGQTLARREEQELEHGREEKGELQLPLRKEEAVVVAAAASAAAAAEVAAVEEVRRARRIKEATSRRVR